MVLLGKFAINAGWMLPHGPSLLPVVVDGRLRGHDEKDVVSLADRAGLTVVGLGHDSVPQNTDF
jgi:hypothetical protein